MCEPVTIGLAIASAVGQVASARQQGRAQRASNANQAAVQREEQRDAAETRIGDRMKQARRERARARVAAAEGGVGGQSFALQIKQSEFDQDLDAARINKNLGTAIRRTDAQQRSLDAQTANPNALDFVSAGLSGYSSGLQIRGAVAGARGTPTGTPITGAVPIPGSRFA